MGKSKENFSEACKEYCDTLDRIISDLNSLIYEIESQAITRISDPFPTELVHDAVPLVRKIKTALQTAEYSRYHYSKHL